MRSLNQKSRKKPEEKIQEAIVKMLRYRGWLVKRMIGNMYQSGFPDLFACHTKYGIRFIEVKDPKRRGDVYTTAQKEWFPKFQANGCPVWVLIGDSEREYKKLFEPGNWWQYLQTFKDHGFK